MSIAQSEAADARNLPIINVSGLHGDAIDRAVVWELRLACTNTGFFYITGMASRPRKLIGSFSNRAGFLRCRWRRSLLYR